MTASRTDTVTAFVLSGGGAKGAFSAGALDYLIRQGQVTPQIITGTSAGAICATVIAQARTPAELHAVAGTLRDDILRMSVKDSAFVKQPWLAALDGTSAGEDIEHLIRGKTRPPIPPDPTAPKGTDVLAGAGPAPLTFRQGWEDLKSLVANLPAQHRAMKQFGVDSRSIMLLDPLEAAFRGTTPGTGPAPIDEGAVARDGVRLRLTITALNDGCPRYITESGTVVESDAVTPAGTGDDQPGVISGLLASSSVPMVFPPRPIGSDVYVDGGVVQNIPLEPAVALGATDIYLVLADPLRCPPPRIDYRTANLLEVGMRAEATVAFYAQQQRDVAARRPEGVSITMIDPTITAISTFETDPGLLTITMDYGWLRACGETATKSDDDRAHAHHLADVIVTGRVRSWYLEAGLGGSGDSHEAALASAKKLVGDSLAAWQALGLEVPDGAMAWSTAPELHEQPSA